jgi:hypothetical protein
VFTWSTESNEWTQNNLCHNKAGTGNTTADVPPSNASCGEDVWQHLLVSLCTMSPG